VWWRSIHADIPASVAYPIHDVMALTRHGFYLAGTFAYMTALAILQGYQTIGLWGINDMRSYHDPGTGERQGTSEPREADRNLEYWLGVAEGRGIEVVVPDDALVLKTWWRGRYAYDGQPPEWWAGLKQEYGEEWSVGRITMTSLEGMATIYQGSADAHEKGIDAYTDHYGGGDDNV